MIKSKKIANEDKIEFSKFLEKAKNEKDSNKLIDDFDALPKSVYEIVKPKINMDRVINISIFLASIYIISTLFSYIQSLSMTSVSNNFAKRLRGNISKKINKLPLKYFDSHETGDVLSRVTNDVDTIAQNMNQSLVSLVTSITLFLGSIIMMFITNSNIS